MQKGGSTSLTTGGYNWRGDPYRSVVPPIYLGSAYGFDSVDQGAAIIAGEKFGYAYSRLGNPTVHDFETWLAELESGERAWATCSGLAAVKLLVMALTEKKKEIVTSPYIYGGTYHLFHLLNRSGWSVKFVENANDPDSWKRAITPKTAFVFLETPANPKLDVFDIAAIAKITHQKRSWLVVDSTIATPILQKPLDFGADAVLHSVTKYLIRQSVGLGGALVGSKKFTKVFGESLSEWLICLGTIMHPLTAWFALNNSHTLENDMMVFCGNAERVAYFLGNSPKIKKIYYPYHPAHPAYELAERQMPRGASGMLAFETRNYQSAKKLVESLKSIILAPHLGDVRDLIVHPASTTHSQLSDKEREAVGISKTLIRLSVGLGNAKPTIADLKQALNKI